MPAATEAHYADGYLCFVQDSVLMARPFDAGSRRFTGEAFPTGERVQFDPSTWKANFSFSRSGLLVYQQLGGTLGSQIRLVDRAGRTIEDAGPGGNHFNLRLVGGGKGVVYSSQPGPNSDLIYYDFQRHQPRWLTRTVPDEDAPLPSPDGSEVAFTVSQANDTTALRRYSIRAVPADGAGASRELFHWRRDVWPLDWTSGGTMLLGAGDYTSVFADSIGVLDLANPADIRWVRGGDHDVMFASLSHDRRWVAITAGASDAQVFLVPAPGMGGAGGVAEGTRIQISTAGGGVPRWRGDDRELFYTRPDGMVVAVPLAPGTMQAGRELELFRTTLRPYLSSMDVTPDGQRFALNMLASEGAAPIVLVSNWKKELKPR
jgi:hypothetical protein